MNESNDIPISEIYAATHQKLKDLIRSVWGSKASNRNKNANVKTPKQLDLPLPPMALSDPREKEKKQNRSRPTNKQLTLQFRRPPTIKPVNTDPEQPKLQKPKIISTLFSKKIDMSKPPFYTNADKWYNDNFKKENLGYAYSVRYFGPTLDDSFVFGSYAHDNDSKSFNKFYDDREKNMEYWNALVKEKIKKKYADEYGGMNEQSMKLSEIKEVIDEIISEELKEVNHTTDSSGKSVIAVGAPGSIARFAVEHPDIIKHMRDWVKDCPWGEQFEESDIDDLSDIQILQGVQRHYEGGIKQFIQDATPTNPPQTEGVGYVHAKDRAKDPKSIKKPGGGTEHWRIKFQSAGDLKKHGNTEMSKVRETIRELVDEMVNGERLSKYTDNKCKCGGNLKYVADIGAPGTGQSWDCEKCKSSYVKLGNQFIDTSEVDPTEAPPWELDPSDVMESVMPHSQSTPNDPQQLWKIVDSLEYGQSISFYNPKNPNSNTTAPWIYIKKLLSHGGGGHEQSGFNLSIEPRMDARTQKSVLTGVDNLRSEDDVTEDEVSLALEAVVQNIDILSMYYIETEEQAPKRKPYEGDPDHDIGDYERFGPDQLTAKDVTESKNMKKHELRSLIKESFDEVQSEMHGFEEQQELLSMKRIQSYAHWGFKNASKHPNEMQALFQKIVKDIDGLVKAHEHGHEVPIKQDSSKKSPLGVTQETVSKTKQLLDQMISQRRKK